MRTFHKDGTLPAPGTAVFVFGSNLAGIHGAGAARVAHEEFNAETGVGVGPTGQAYAIPTKNKSIRTMPLDSIRPHIEKFIRYAKHRSFHTFFVTRIGCGLAGYSDLDIAPMFRDAPENCSFAEQWREWFDTPARIPPAVTARCCPSCGYLVGQFELDHMRVNLTCPRCGRAKMSEFQPLKLPA